MIASPKAIGAANKQSLETLVNGETRQDSETSDLLFGVKEIVSFLSQGTTLEPGTLIMTGTPAGVALGMEEPVYLRDGDIVEVKIGGLGALKNTMRFI
jgi:2-keto-4-pentenoate hydratase/2-oxohepta-3-ene-1,7-dioic acid hydratase in catechol pathway